MEMSFIAINNIKAIIAIKARIHFASNRVRIYFAFYFYSKSLIGIHNTSYFLNLGFSFAFIDSKYFISSLIIIIALTAIQSIFYRLPNF